jgi:hypothetical protein
MKIIVVGSNVTISATVVTPLGPKFCFALFFVRMIWILNIMSDVVFLL